jgi:hypothetical protein
MNSERKRKEKRRRRRRRKNRELFLLYHITLNGNSRKQHISYKLILFSSPVVVSIVFYRSDIQVPSLFK